MQEKEKSTEETSFRQEKKFLKARLETANKKLEANFKRLEEFGKELKASLE